MVVLQPKLKSSNIKLIFDHLDIRDLWYRYIASEKCQISQISPTISSRNRKCWLSEKPLETVILSKF